MSCRDQIRGEKKRQLYISNRFESGEHWSREQAFDIVEIVSFQRFHAGEVVSLPHKNNRVVPGLILGYRSHRTFVLSPTPRVELFRF